MDPTTSGDRRSMAMKSVSRMAVDLPRSRQRETMTSDERAQERHRAESSNLHRLDAEASGLWQRIQTLMQAYLLLAGYHQHHRGEWRRHRYDES